MNKHKQINSMDIINTKFLKKDITQFQYSEAALMKNNHAVVMFYIPSQKN